MGLRKFSEKKKIASGIFVLFLLVGVVGGAVVLTQFGGVLGSFTDGNLCVDGVSELEVKEDVFGMDKVMSIDASTGCDNIIFGKLAKIPKDELEKSTSKGTYQAGNSIKVGLVNYEAYFYKEVQENTKSFVYKPRLKEVQCNAAVGCGSEAYQKCVDFYNEKESYVPYGPYFPVEGWSGASSDEKDLWMETPGGLYNEVLHCIRLEPAGAVAQFELDQKTGFKGLFKACSSGSCGSATVTDDKKSATIKIGGQPVVHITRQGSYVGDVRSIDWSPFIPMCDSECSLPNNEIDWKLAGRSAYQEYRNYKTKKFKTCLADTIEDDDESLCLQKMESHASSVLADQSGAFKERIGSWVWKIESSGDEVRIYADQGEKIQKGDFRILAAFNLLQVSLKQTKPDIIESEFEDVQLAGLSSTEVVVPVRNTADVAGEIETRIACSGPVTGGSQVKTVGAGERGKFFITVSTDSSKTQDVSCTVSAYDTDVSSGVNKDTERLVVHVKANAKDDDKDGIPNKFDSCDDRKGPQSNGGCPVKEICGDGVDNDGDGDVDENCGSPGSGDNGGSTKTGCEPIFKAEGLVQSYEVNNPFCGKGLIGKIAFYTHLLLSLLIGLVSSGLGYKASRWIHGEMSTKGGFSVSKKKMSRVKRGSVWIGIAAAAVAFIAGFVIAFQLPVIVQIISLIILIAVPNRDKAKKVVYVAGKKAKNKVKNKAETKVSKR